MNIEDEWTQSFMIHCPDKNCKGMLLDNPFKYELKCSECGKYFINKDTFVEVKLNGELK